MARQRRGIAAVATEPLRHLPPLLSLPLDISLASVQCSGSVRTQRKLSPLHLSISPSHFLVFFVSNPSQPVAEKNGFELEDGAHGEDGYDASNVNNTLALFSGRFVAATRLFPAVSKRQGSDVMLYFYSENGVGSSTVAKGLCRHCSSVVHDNGNFWQWCSGINFSELYSLVFCTRMRLTRGAYETSMVEYVRYERDPGLSLAVGERSNSRRTRRVE